MRQYLIADSGGSKTDWCFIDFNKKKTFFTTESYHPSNFNDLFLDEQKKKWESNKHMFDSELIFFGAGCLNIEGENQVEQILFSIGFKNIKVKSDLFGAGLALYGNKIGHIAILGTGSVFFTWNQNEVQNIKGGYGHLIGDEGSGFYFGKLVFDAFVEGSLSSEQLKVFESVVDVSFIKGMIEKKKHKFILGEISLKLSKYSSLFKNFHTKNIDLFCQKYVDSNHVQKISVIGSYGYYNQEIIRSVFIDFNYRLHKIVRSPIELIVNEIVF